MKCSPKKVALLAIASCCYCRCASALPTPPSYSCVHGGGPVTPSSPASKTIVLHSQIDCDEGSGSSGWNYCDYVRRTFRDDGDEGRNSSTDVRSFRRRYRLPQIAVVKSQNDNNERSPGSRGNYGRKRLSSTRKSMTALRSQNNDDDEDWNYEDYVRRSFRENDDRDNLFSGHKDGGGDRDERRKRRGSYDDYEDDAYARELAKELASGRGLNLPNNEPLKEQRSRGSGSGFFADTARDGNIGRGRSYDVKDYWGQSFGASSTTDTRNDDLSSSPPRAMSADTSMTQGTTDAKGDASSNLFRRSVGKIPSRSRGEQSPFMYQEDERPKRLSRQTWGQTQLRKEQSSMGRGSVTKQYDAMPSPPPPEPGDDEAGQPRRLSQQTWGTNYRSTASRGGSGSRKYYQNDSGKRSTPTGGQSSIGRTTRSMGRGDASFSRLSSLGDERPRPPPTDEEGPRRLSQQTWGTNYRTSSGGGESGSRNDEFDGGGPPPPPPPPDPASTGYPGRRSFYSGRQQPMQPIMPPPQPPLRPPDYERLKNAYFESTQLPPPIQQPPIPPQSPRGGVADASGRMPPSSLPLSELAGRVQLPPTSYEEPIPRSSTTAAEQQQEEQWKQQYKLELESRRRTNAYRQPPPPPYQQLQPQQQEEQYKQELESRRRTNAYRQPPPPPYPQQQQQQWRQSPSHYFNRPPMQQRPMQRQFQSPPMPGGYEYYNYKPPSSVPLSQLATQPNTEPLDRPSSGSSTGASSWGAEKPLSFSQLDAMEFSRPYQEGSSTGGRRDSMDFRRPQTGRFATRSGGVVGDNIGYPPRQQQYPGEQYQEPPPRRQTNGSGSKSFKPAPFQHMSQSDFREPYRESMVMMENGSGGDPYRGPGGGAPPQFSEPYQESGGPPPQFGQPPASFFGDENMPQSPFAVPPPMFFAPPPNANRPQGRSAISKEEEEGVKVPKDPFSERQKKNQGDPTARQPSSQAPPSERAPKDPFREQLSSTSSSEKVPRDPFKEQRPQKQPVKERWQPAKERKQSSSEGQDMKVPKDPFVERQQQHQKRMNDLQK